MMDRTDFTNALTRLHMLAGAPSTRTIARNSGLSHTTVAEALSGNRLPSWQTVAIIIRILGGDPRDFIDVYLRASGKKALEPLPVPSFVQAVDRLTAAVERLAQALEDRPL